MFKMLVTYGIFEVLREQVKVNLFRNLVYIKIFQIINNYSPKWR